MWTPPKINYKIWIWDNEPCEKETSVKEQPKATAQDDGGDKPEKKAARALGTQEEAKMGKKALANMMAHLAI